MNSGRDYMTISFKVSDKTKEKLVEFYEDLALKKAAELLRRYRYTIYER